MIANAGEYFTGALAARLVPAVFARASGYKAVAKGSADWTAFIAALKVCRTANEAGIDNALLTKIDTEPGFLMMDLAVNLETFFLKGDKTSKYAKVGDISNEDLNGVGRNVAFQMLYNARDKWPNVYRAETEAAVDLSKTPFSDTLGKQNTFFDFATHRAIPLDMPPAASVLAVRGMIGVTCHRDRCKLVD